MPVSSAIKVLLPLLLSNSILASPTPPASPPGSPWNHHNKDAVYFLRVDPAGSSIVAIEVGSNGLLTSSTSSTSTGGVGLQGQNYSSPNLAPTALDPLQGQQAVSCNDEYLFTVNSGSNTVVMFSINPHNPLDLQIVGSPAPTLGEFPGYITYSSKNKKACVLNGGKVNGVTCFSVSSKGLTADGAGLRALNFPATTPPQLGGPKGSGSDIQFNADESKVIVTFKGTSKPPSLGHIVVYDVDQNGDVSTTGKNNMVNPLGAPFGFAINPKDANEIFISDVGFGGGALVNINDQTNKVSVVSIVNETSFKASCWAAYSPLTGNYYELNAGTNVIGVVSSAGKLVDTLSFNKDLGGALDSAVDGTGRYLYFLTAVNSIGVLDLKTGKQVQQYAYGTAEDRPFWSGMSYYTPSSGGWGWGGHW